jgi:hypothetical protein
MNGHLFNGREQAMNVLRGILLPAVPIAIAALGLTQGAASAGPKNPCDTIRRAASDDYHLAVAWDRAADSALAAGDYAHATSYYETAHGYLNTFYIAVGRDFDRGCYSIAPLAGAHRGQTRLR